MTSPLSPAQELARDLLALPLDKREEIYASISPSEGMALHYYWPFWARPNQIPPKTFWRICAIIAGRGFGKSRCGAQWLLDEIINGRADRFGVAAPTAGDVRDICIEGESGLLACCPPWFPIEYLPSKNGLRAPNGAIGLTLSADVPDRFRGKQYHRFWADELASWTQLDEAWEQIMLGLRLGVNPQLLLTTTPRPLPLLRKLVDGRRADVTVIRGSTRDNIANLPSAYLEDLRRYDGTARGRQEIEGEILEDRTGAMFSGAWIQRSNAPNDLRCVVAVDPAITTSATSDETGIVVVGADEDGRAWVLADRTAKLTPDAMAREVLALYRTFDCVATVIETNRGGHFVRSTIESASRGAPVTIVEVNAARGKATRAEPVAALYEQGRVAHAGHWKELEREMIEWDPVRSPKSPNRIDALVYALTYLLLGASYGDEYRSATVRGRLSEEAERRGLDDDLEAFEDDSLVVSRGFWGG